MIYCIWSFQMRQLNSFFICCSLFFEIANYLVHINFKTHTDRQEASSRFWHENGFIEFFVQFVFIKTFQITLSSIRKNQTICNHSLQPEKKLLLPKNLIISVLIILCFIHLIATKQQSKRKKNTIYNLYLSN